MFKKFLYNLGLRLVRNNYEKTGAATKCPCCHTWSRDMEEPYAFHIDVKETNLLDDSEVRYTGEVYQCCAQCGSVSYWHYALAPVAVCLGFTPPLAVFQHTHGYKSPEEFVLGTVVCEEETRVLTSLPEHVRIRLRGISVSDLGKSPRLKV